MHRCLLAFIFAFSSAAPAGAAKPQTDAGDVSGYKIRSSDVLDLAVYPQGELNGKLVVLPDGVVIVPTVGRVDVRGLTREEAVEVLQKQLSKYFVKPKVTLSIIKFSARQVVVAGEVHEGGIQTFEEGMTLSELIARAGGFTANADRGAVRVYRGDPDNRSVKVIDVDAIISKKGVPDYPLAPGDLIEVPVRVNIVFIWGEVTNPGPFDYRPGLRLIELVSLARGITRSARTGSVRVYRKDGAVVDVDFSKVLAGRMDEDITLHAGDIVYVPTRSWAKLTAFIQDLMPYVTLLTLGLTVFLVTKA